MTDATSPRFRSRIDAIVGVILAVPSAVLAWQLVAQARDGRDSRTVPLAIFVITTAVVLWLVLDTSYRITDTDLVIRGGPLRERVPLQSISRVRRSHTLIAAPALSLRRLEIHFGTGRIAVISPERETEFLALLHARVPGAELPPVP